MTAARKRNLVAISDYLAGELESSVRHEYVAGVVHAMAGASNAHSIVAGNFFGLMHAGLRNRPCQPFTSDTKVRIQLPTHVRFYYPDGMVVCHPNDQGDSFQDNPVVILEVVSESTRRVDEEEKRDAYFAIPSLRTYLVAEQTSCLVTVHRRTDHGFEAEVYEGRDAVIPLPDIGAELPLAELYERVEFGAGTDR